MKLSEIGGPPIGVFDGQKIEFIEAIIEVNAVFVSEYLIRNFPFLMKKFIFPLKNDY